MRDHSVSSEVPASAPHYAKMFVDTMNIILKRGPIVVKGSEIRGDLVASPGRKKALRSFFEAQDWVNGLNPMYRFEACTRRLELWDDTGCVKVGLYCQADQEWKWGTAVAATIGVTMPIDIDDDASRAQRPDPQGQSEAKAQPAKKDEDIKDGTRRTTTPARTRRTRPRNELWKRATRLHRQEAQDLAAEQLTVTRMAHGPQDPIPAEIDI